jgi:hypothetical protein
MYNWCSGGGSAGEGCVCSSAQISTGTPIDGLAYRTFSSVKSEYRITLSVKLLVISRLTNPPSRYPHVVSLAVLFIALCESVFAIWDPKVRKRSLLLHFPN